MEKNKRYFKYWGKASKEDDSYHLLPYHCLDVAAVASLWWDQSPAIQHGFLQYSGQLSVQQIKAWAIFFIALHDYGKFDVRFQRKAIDTWEILQVETDKVPALSIENSKSYDHGSAGLYWFAQDREKGETGANNEHFAQIVNLVEEADDASDAWLSWIRRVTGHHGFVYADDQPAPNCSLSITVDQAFAERDKTARQAWLFELERLFLHPAGLSLDDAPPKPSPLLAGFCSVSDWLGSRSDGTNFCYKALPVDDLRAYFEKKCMEDARRVLDLAGIISVAKSFKGVGALLKQGYKPRQLQKHVDDLPVAPGLTLVEAPTGSGKTEMALAYAWRLVTDNLADSIVLAMPTQATANAMLQRVEKQASILFEEKPNLILAHGNARFNEKFIALKQAGNTVQGKEEAWAQCNEWLSQSRKRVFLGQIGICTIDQVLVSVLPVRHRFVRGFGIGRSVLIVDEVHAYDAYMYGLLEAVLAAQHAAGGASILLSATLYSQLRNNLLATYDKTTEFKETALPYPLISWSGKQEIPPISLPEGELPPERRVQIECCLNEDLLPDDELIQRVIQAAEQGAQVAIICNLVDVAQRLAREMQQQTTVPVDIFHARYCLHDRQIKEQSVLEHYGVEAERIVGRILVATQVVEQSLDVDFDWLITQLCPVDLLFQRMGRLHRHDRKRPAGFDTPLCTVLLPTGTDFGIHGFIYANVRVMWRTAHKLQNCPDDTLIFPGAYRDWIEHVYSEEAWGIEPAGIESRFMDYENDLLIKRCKAGEMLNWAKNKPFPDIDENVRAVTRDGEFNLTVVPSLETVSGHQLLDATLYDCLAEWQQAEALAMNTVGVPKSWGKFLPDTDEEGRIWLAMQVDGEQWRVQRKDIGLTYHPVWGMEMKE